MYSEKSILEKAFDQLIAKQAVVEVYRDRLAEEPLVGCLLQYSPHVFIINKLDELYRHDGVAVARISDITRIKSGGRELEAGAKLREPGARRFEFPDVALLEISSAMTFFQKEFGHVSLYTEHLSSSVCFIGEMRDLDDDFVLLWQFGTHKTMDRSELLIRLDEVTHAEAGGQYEHQLQALFSDSKQ